MRKVVLRLAYDGTNFVGSQWQTNGRSVQAVLEQSWAQLTQEQQRCIFAGRTDAGVHAHGQVVHIQTETRHDGATIQRALNAILPDDVVVRDVWDAGDAFHARYSARWRKYRYLLDTAPVRLPLLRHYVLHVGQPLDTVAMHQALQTLPGEHDFAAFASVPQDVASSTVRSCYRAWCGVVEWADCPLIAVEVVANGFLRHMVRTLVGTLLLVGQHRLTCGAFEQILASRDRRQAGPTAAAHGLMLMAVGYPAEVVSAEMQTLLDEEK